MSSTNLTATQHLILTVVAWRGPATPYELKDYFQRIVKFLVDVPHTMLYTELPKLAQLGLVHEEQETTGRRRKTYTVTKAGRAVTRAWLGDAECRPPSVDDEAMMKFLYSEMSTPEAVAALAGQQLAYYEQRLGMVEASLASNLENAHRTRYLRTGARLLRDQTKLNIKFWKRVLEDPDCVSGG